VTLGVCASVCPPSRISLGGEGNVLYSVISSCIHLMQKCRIDIAIVEMSHVFICT